MHSALIGLADARRSPDWVRWQSLTEKAPPFLSPEFFTLAARFVEAEPLVAEAWDSEQLIGALPVVREGDRLVALRCDYTPGYDYCGSEQGVAAIWQALLADPTWSELDLAKIPATSPLATQLPILANADGCPVVVRSDSRHPYFALPGFEAALSPKFLANLQRCARKAGGIELERIAIPDRAAFDEALEIEAKAWKRAAGTSIEADPRATHLFRTLSRLMGRRHHGALYFLRANGRRIATLFAIEDGHSLFALKIGYDPDFANLSPGHLLVWKVAADAAARGLQELDFVGREDDWKRKWTTRVHPHVALSIYRGRTGLARYAARHLVRPRLPETLRGGLGNALPRSCQRADLIGVHTLTQRIKGRVTNGLGIKSAIVRAVRPPPARDPLGKPSAFAPGSWVRVKPTAELRTALDDGERTRGLLFTETQWQTAGEVFRVGQQVRRLRDDHGKMRPVSRTVLLDGVDCSGHGPEPTGCGRHCPMMYRDEWLEPAPAPTREPPAASTAAHAHVRSLDDIRAGLDLRGRRDGLTFMPEMEAYADKRFPIANTITRVFEYDRWTPTRAPIYVLGGLHCSGAVLGTKGPCDRACSLLWHADWLVVEPR
jgi:CelD/BcsL family acetyltransferase involved in cellulose biosynthesis